MEKFMLLGGQRTGTTFLQDCLQSQPHIICLNELFTMHRVAEDSYPIFLKTSLKMRLLHTVFRRIPVRQFLDQTFEQNEAHAVGFKFMYPQSRRLSYKFPYVIKYAEENRLKIVHIIRRNYLRTLISRMTAVSSNIYHSTKKIAANPILLQPKRVLTSLRAMQREQQYWRKRLGIFEHINIF